MRRSLLADTTFAEQLEPLHSDPRWTTFTERLGILLGGV